MIEILIFHIHIISILYAFTKNWQNGTLKDGFLAVGIILLMFSIGWAITSTLAALIMPAKWNTIFFNKDTLSLILLLIPESIFYYHFFIKDRAKLKDSSIEKPI